MTRALVLAARRKASRLEPARRLAHRAFARIAFVFETVCLAAGYLVVVTLALLGGHRLLAAREWGLFLAHYAAAPGPARAPVDLFILLALLTISLFVGACRLSAARLVWRATDRQGPV